MNKQNMKINTRFKTFEEERDCLRDMYLSAIRFLEGFKLEHGAYFRKINGDNWLIYWNKTGGFIGKPMNEEGWFCWEFDNDGTYNHAEPMFYKDLNWCINKIKAVI